MGGSITLINSWCHICNWVEDRLIVFCIQLRWTLLAHFCHASYKTERGQTSERRQPGNPCCKPLFFGIKLGASHLPQQLWNHPAIAMRWSTAPSCYITLRSESQFCKDASYKRTGWLTRAKQKKTGLNPWESAPRLFYNLLDASSMANDTSVGLQCRLVIL